MYRTWEVKQFYFVFVEMNACINVYFCSILLSILFSAGCMRDVRLNGHYMPLDSQPRDGVSQVSVQGLSKGCSSDSCKRNQCSTPFTCVDLWRVHECRYTQTCTHKCSCTTKHTHTSGLYTSCVVFSQRHKG